MVSLFNFRYSPKSISVQYNSLSRNDSGEIIPSVKLIWNKNWQHQEFDIALIQLAKPMQLNQTNAKAISLADKDYNPPTNSSITVFGWGYTNQNNSMKKNTILKYGQLNIIDQNECKKQYDKIQFTITDNVFCAAAQNGKDVCYNDIGGPAIQNDKLVGIVSWGLHCGTSPRPGIYTKIGNFVDWIHSIINAK